MNRDDLIDDALRKINGARQEEYGDVYDSFTTISLGWDIITKNALATHGCVSPMHVGLMMDWLKTSRLLVDISHEDSWVDKVGYAALSAEVAERYSKTGGVSPDAQPEEDKNGNDAVITQNIHPMREKVDNWEKNWFAERMSKAGMTDEDVAEYDPYVEPKTCQKIDGRTRKPCGLPLVGRQKKFCSKHVPNNTKAARKYYGKRSKRQVNNQL